MVVKYDQGMKESNPFPAMVAISAFVMPGAFLFATTSHLFFAQGGGTPSPAPKAMTTQQLVIEGPYRYTLNPMVLGLVWCILGVSLLFHSPRLFLLDIAFMMVSFIMFRFFEEPDLRNRFEQAYIDYWLLAIHSATFSLLSHENEVGMKQVFKNHYLFAYCRIVFLVL